MENRIRARAVPLLNAMPQLTARRRGRRPGRRRAEPPVAEQQAERSCMFEATVHSSQLGRPTGYRPIDTSGCQKGLAYSTLVPPTQCATLSTLSHSYTNSVPWAW
jgi:hypothetical protein